MRTLTVPAIFTRASSATNPSTGLTVLSGVPRYTVSQSILIEEGVTNLVIGSLGQADGDSIADGIGIGGPDETVTVSSDFAWHGTNSFKLTPPSSGIIFDMYLGVGAGYFVQTLSTVFTASFYVRRDDGGIIALSDIDKIYLYTTTDGNSIFSPSSLVAAERGWYRVSGTRAGLLGTGGVTIIGVAFAATGSCWGHVMYVDGLQVEPTSYMTSWQNPPDGLRSSEVLTAPATLLLKDQGSMSCRVKLSSGGTSSRYILLSDNTSTFRIVDYAGGAIRYLTYDGALQVVTTPASYTSWMTDGLYHDIVVTWNNLIASIYVDGVFVLSGAIHNVALNPFMFNIGSAGDGSSAFDGYIDSLQTFNRVLTDTEVLALHNGVAGTTLDNATLARMNFNGDLTIQSDLFKKFYGGGESYGQDAYATLASIYTPDNSPDVVTFTPDV